MVRPHFIGLDQDAWGLDHRAWSVLAHVYPAAAIPVLQLSINGTKDFTYHLELGQRLAALRERGILIIARATSSTTSAASIARSPTARSTGRCASRTRRGRS